MTEENKLITYLLGENKQLKQENFKMRQQLELIEGLSKGLLYYIPFEDLFGSRTKFEESFNSETKGEQYGKA